MKGLQADCHMSDFTDRAQDGVGLGAEPWQRTEVIFDPAIVMEQAAVCGANKPPKMGDQAFFAADVQDCAAVEITLALRAPVSKRADPFRALRFAVTARACANGFRDRIHRRRTGGRLPQFFFQLCDLMIRMMQVAFRAGERADPVVTLVLKLSNAVDIASFRDRSPVQHLSALLVQSSFLFCKLRPYVPQLLLMSLIDVFELRLERGVFRL